ncbi:EscU/YscU/HrcU family type III secretion system export apparatus switch protein [Chitiniphilus purpureus]|uniref:EscU/YscU/HrcU family type III secretion system export apparatus switch protein n=1 Tax=Chitiniphilus purpureus TaxID=2981137 RepID=A0ABY6DI56_9NEIS|nr:EscU/YscU/HrcU family type III secretion system export apparatus switch protein [Chitiniphilus sp. CD1]UXY13712.1 EscU/YscU/HrcU family type III secretion system export apparatus switch protein [Chitiniphilus sp. CD1]
MARKVLYGTPDRQQAVALAYQEGSGSPRVVAKGQGMLAERIIEKAREAGVFVHESPELVAMLMQVDLDQRIPPQLYRAVAELLAFVYLIEAGAEPPPPTFSLDEQVADGEPGDVTGR